MKWTARRVLLQIFATHIGRILLGALLSVVGGIMSPNGTIGELIYEWNQGVTWTVIFYIGAGLTFVECMILLAYGLIINPIKAFKEKRKNK